MSQNEIKVTTGVDSLFIENVITRDITTKACIFDLIDNSIDAAKEDMIEKGILIEDEFGMPEKYNGYKIVIQFSEDKFQIWDNCSGIQESEFSKKMFIIGKESNHEYGLGKFGVGLKRALLKLGDNYFINTSNGDYTIKLELSRADFDTTKPNELSAIKETVSKSSETVVRVDSLDNKVKKEFKNTAWIESLRLDISKLYASFIKKGLLIELIANTNKYPKIEPFLPDLREDKHIQIQRWHETVEGVDVSIECGLHKDFVIRAGFSGANKSITEDYGWYFICNDRVIQSCVTEGLEYGWTGKWHGEYYGFVGRVRFDCQDVESLPWDTTKTRIITDDLVFLEVRDRLESFANKFKAQKKVALNKSKPKENDNSKVEEPSPEPGPFPTPKDTGPSPQPAPKPNNDSKPDNPSIILPDDNANKAQHIERCQTLLPEHIPETKDTKIDSLLEESGRIYVSSYPFACAGLLRSIMEQSLKLFLSKKGRFEDVKSLVFEQQDKDGRPFSDAQKRKYKPTHANMIDWLKKNRDIFPDIWQRDCSKSLNEFNSDLEHLNAVLHQSQLTDSGRIKGIRNRCFPLLRVYLDEIRDANSRQ